ncbi:hypothetical protein E3V08_01195 [Candidatus Atribacteria bacterium MT.SAG.1]|nr:hypothetical protein E3V08_01195 [Candidatus Atribacteria bacterium MT.SAG.1]
MKFLNILGLTLFSFGIIALVGFGLYKFFQDTTIPAIIRYGIVAMILGTIIILTSLIKERLKEKKL